SSRSGRRVRTAARATGRRGRRRRRRARRPRSGCLSWCSLRRRGSAGGDERALAAPPHSRDRCRHVGTDGRRVEGVALPGSFVEVPAEPREEAGTRAELRLGGGLCSGLALRRRRWLRREVVADPLPVETVREERALGEPPPVETLEVD